MESPPTFVWYFDWVMKIVEHRVEAEVGSTGVQFQYNIDHNLVPKRGETCKYTGLPKSRKMCGTETVSALLYADDLTALTDGPDQAKKILEILNDECRRWGLYVSFGKTYTPEWPTGGDELSHSGKSLFSIGENAIGHLTKFKALGQILDGQDPNGYIKYYWSSNSQISF